MIYLFSDTKNSLIDALYMIYLFSDTKNGLMFPPIFLIFEVNLM